MLQISERRKKWNKYSRKFIRSADYYYSGLHKMWRKKDEIARAKSTMNCRRYCTRSTSILIARLAVFFLCRSHENVFQFKIHWNKSEFLLLWFFHYFSFFLFFAKIIFITFIKKFIATWLFITYSFHFAKKAKKKKHTKQSEVKRKCFVRYNRYIFRE